MLFEDQDEESMAKEININFRTSEEFRDHIYREAGALDMPVSEMIRAAVLLALPQFEQIPDLLNIRLEDIKGVGK